MSALAGRPLAPLARLWIASMLSIAAAIAPKPALARDGAEPHHPFATTITVNTVEDVTFSMSETCAAFPAQCTLRRAIVQARALAPAQRPVLIAFNLPASQSNNPTTPAYWTVALAEGASSPLRDLAGGQITIDGNTQPGGRSGAPKIVIVGTQAADRLVINDGNNAIRGVAFQYLRVLFNGSDNVVEQIWMGLTSDGQGVYVVRNDPAIDNRAGVEEAEASRRNVYRNSVITGAKTNAITLRGENGLVQGNLFGTRADGTIPTIDPARWCKPNARFNNWYAGAGVVISGKFNTVENNRFAGLLWSSDDPLNTPPTAITIEDNDNKIRNNVIGVDAAGKAVGTCGNGIVLTDRNNVIQGNRIVRAGVKNDDPLLHPTSGDADTGAIGLRGTNVITALLGNNLLRGNMISESVEAIYFYPSVPDDYAYFNPAKITAIIGTLVTGQSGDPGRPPAPAPPVNSQCNGCVIEVFRDTLDPFDDALTSLGLVTATGTGAFTFALPAPLAPGEGLRTTSTSVANNQIQGFPAGTTTRMSTVMYLPDGPVSNTVPGPAAPLAPPAYPVLASRAVPALPAPAYKTVITVTKTTDPSTSQSQTCYTTPGVGQTPFPNECTLRRAVVEARSLPAGSRPALIAFKIPLADPGYDAATQTWKIQLTPGSTLRRLEGGNITIDGHTQRTNVGGRTTGPTIVVTGTATTSVFVWDHDDNIIRGLNLIGFGIVLNGSRNFVQGNWLGLMPDGQSIFFPAGNRQFENDATIQDASASVENVYRNNTVAGSRAAAIVVRGERSWVVGNRIGTRPDGTIPAPPNPAQPCASLPGSGSWLGGGGIQVFGKGHQIGGPSSSERNVIAGLLVESPDPNETQPIGIQLGSVRDFLVMSNWIGRDTTGADAGTCGEGIRNNSAYAAVRDNVIFTRRASAINHLGDVIGGNGSTYRANVITSSASAIVFGPTVPNARAFFNAGRVTSINGTAVAGTNGLPGLPPGGADPVDSTCPFCTVEVFLEDRDGAVETLQSLGTAMADASGNWSFTLPAPLGATQGLRTVSTINNYGTMKEYEAGSSTGVSRLYTEGGVASVALASLPPAEVMRNRPVTLTATLGPDILVAGGAEAPEALLQPVTFAWRATGLAGRVVTTTATSNTQAFTWATVGDKTLTVRASNLGGEAEVSARVRVVTQLRAMLPAIYRR